MRNENDIVDVGRISNETKKIFTLETISKNVTSNVNENKIKKRFLLKLTKMLMPRHFW